MRGAGGGEAAGAGEEAVPYPLDGDLDLHQFRPAEVGEVVAAYLDACRARGIVRVRIVHGKGTGTLRTTVHTLLRRRGDVRAFGPGDEWSGGWGATWVELRPPERGPER